MGFRFSKRIKIAPGVRMNISKTGISGTFGPQGSSVSVGKQGVHANVGITGTGLSYRQKLSSAGGGGGGGGVVNASGVGGGNSAIVVAGCFSLLCAAAAVILLLTGAWPVALVTGAVAAGMWYYASKLHAAEKADRVAQEIEAAREKERLKRERHDDLMRRYNADADLVRRIVAGEVWVGQTALQLRDARGEPADIDTKLMKTKRRDVWKYDQTGANRFATKITLENDVVVGWDMK